MALAMLGGLPIAPAVAADAPLATLGTPEMFAIRLNGVELDATVSVRRRGAELTIAREDWEGLRLRPPVEDDLLADGQAWRRLEQITGLHWRIDDSTQTLLIDAPAAAFVGSRLNGANGARTATPTVNWGGYFNYDVTLNDENDAGVRNRSVQGLVELGAFGAPGGGVLTGLLRDGPISPSWVRLDSQWTQDFPDRLASLRYGDSVGHGGDWGRPVRFGGIQYATDFSIQPGFLSFPLPAVHGDAALPSTVDVYVNNARQLQSQVPAGPFDLANVPILTGSGEVQMVVHDLLGREQVIQVPYYASPQLLKPGLRSFSYELGFEREDYGLASDHYGRPMAAITDRLGITPEFTREWRAEAIGSEIAAGTSGLWLFPAFGTVGASIAASRASQGIGALVDVNASHQARAWSGSVDLAYGTPEFSQIGAPAGSAPKRRASISLGTALAGTGLSASFVDQQPWQAPAQRVLSFSATREVMKRASLSLVALRDIANQSTTISLTFSLAFADGTHAALSHTRVSANQLTSNDLQIQSPTPEGNGLSYKIGADQGPSRRAVGEAILTTQRADYDFAASTGDGGSAYRVGAAGGVAWLGDSAFLTRKVGGSFAVVEAGGYPNVGVYQDNHLVAHTDADGRALVSGLRGYENNRISIDAGDLPLGAEVSALEVNVVPRARAGIAVRMPVRQVRSASFKIVDSLGISLPPGATVRLDGHDEEFPVGFDGQAWVQGVASHNVLVATWPGKHCVARLDLADAELMAEAGTVRCQ